MRKNLLVAAAIGVLCLAAPAGAQSDEPQARRSHDTPPQRISKSASTSEVQEVWVRRVSYFQGLPDEAFDIAVDQAGNVYVTGKVTDTGNKYDYGTAKFDREGNMVWGPIIENGHQAYDDEAAAIAVDDAYVYVTGRLADANGDYAYGTFKYHRNDGVRVWSRKENGEAGQPDEAVAIAVDTQGNVYVAGNSFSTARQWSYKVIKYDHEGNLKWSAFADADERSANPDKVFAMVIDAAGDVYLTGIGYADDAVLDDYLTVKFNGGNGQVIWKELYHDEAEDQPVALALGGSGSIYVTGRSKNAAGDWDYVTIKYSAADGSTLKTARHDTRENDVPRALVVDEAGNVYVTGGSQHAENNFDYLTIKYNADLEQVWARSYNDPVGNDYDMATDLALDAAGNVYVTGMSIRSSAQGYDCATVKYDAEGTESWVVRYAGPGEDTPNAITIDKEGNVYIAGYSEKAPGADRDYLTIKYGQAGTNRVAQPENQPANDYELGQNYPNPFNPETKFAFALPQAGEVKLRIYSITGQLVAALVDGKMAAGRHAISWNGKDQSGRSVANGVYWYQIIVTDAHGSAAFRQTKKMMLLK